MCKLTILFPRSNDFTERLSIFKKCLYPNIATREINKPNSKYYYYTSIIYIYHCFTIHFWKLNVDWVLCLNTRFYMLSFLEQRVKNHVTCSDKSHLFNNLLTNQNPNNYLKLIITCISNNNNYGFHNLFWKKKKNSKQDIIIKKCYNDKYIIIFQLSYFNRS